MKLSPFEMSMYLAQMLDPESTEYSVNSYFEIKGAGEETVECAVRKMVENRECLRSYYGEQNGEPVRILTDEVPSIRWETAGSEEEVRECATASLPAFDLKTVPARFIGYKLPDGKIILNLQIHHIAIDGRSTMLFTQELFDRLCGHPVAATPDLSERSLEADDYETGKAFYHSLFPDGIPVAEMPLKGQRPKDHPGADKQLTLPFDKEEFAKISSAAKSYGVTTFSVLLSALSITLGMYCGSEDLVIGFPVDMRREEEKTMTGMFVNTGIIRVKPEGSRPAGEFVKEVAQLLRDCSRNRPLPMAEFIREFGVSTDSSRNPVFDVGVNNFFHPEPLTEGDLSVTFNYDLQTLKRDMNVTMHRFGDSMTMVVQYASKLYEANLMNRFLEQYRYTLSLLCEGCDTVAEAERLVPSHMEIYERVNRTEVPVELMSVNKLFEHQVSLHPDKTAVIAAGESLTFGELNCLANRVAHTLIGLGVGKDSIVGMVLDRTKEVFIAEHGILKSGGAFLPMVPEYPDDRIRYCLLNAESPCVITTEAIKAERPELFSDEQPYKTLTVESMTSAGNDENPNLDIDLDSLAYCIYTSGSTGNPKGVMIEHRNMCNYLNANPMHPAIYWHTQDIGTALSVTSISFDMSITERFVTLCNGVTLCMATLDEIHNPMALAKLMTKHHTESIVCTPSYLSSLLEVPEMREPIAALKAYHVGGEAFPSTLIARLKELNPNSHVMNGYGPTETSVCCTSSEILPGQPITIGKPEANVTHYVMDKQKRIVPPGVSGELIICGAGVGRGYVKLPDRTAASFFTCLGQKAYHSGDLVRLNEYGEYDYFGRMDNQVKLRGLRIELDEIENVMLEYPGVKLSKVIVCNNGKEDYLAGYYTAENEVPVSDLRAFLKGRLTPYMVPDAMLQLDKMPLTVNGKIDKKQLPDIADAAEEREYEAPVGAMEEKICSYFAKVLNQERIGATDNFFEIGGTSLSVALIVSTAIHDGLDLVYKNVFEYPTPRMLAKYLETKMGDAAKVEAAAAQESGADETAKTDAAPANRATQTAGSVKYESILSKNCVGNLAGIKTGRLGNVLLTGATGFLGIHVLCELLHSDAVDHIVCLARKRHSIAPETRINHYLMYYFNDLFTDLMEKKVQIIDADITDEDLAEHLKDVPCDVIINCAAMVKHFETGNLIHKINTEGVVHLIELALAVNARLVQVSTLSIAGQVDSDLLDEIILKETDFEIGQRTDTNKYVESKYDAEAAIYDAMEQRGLKAKVIRIGNLMGRRSDGEFQMNFNTNGFVNRLKAYRVLGCFPVSRMDEPVEFSPVDMTAKAVVTLAGTPDEFSVFHANNCHNIHFANVLEAFEECGYHIDVVDDETFSKRFSEALYDETKSLYVSSLIAYADNENKTLQWTLSDNTYTVKALYRLGFSWPVISPVYVRKHLEALATLGFFDPEE